MMLRKFSRKILKKIKFLKAITVVAIPIVFILGCYKNIIERGNPYPLSRLDQSVAISEEELDKFSSSIRKVDGQAESHYKIALYFQQRNKHQFAIDELNRALQLNPLFAKAYNALGISYDKLYRHNQAVSCYQSAIKIDPKLDYVYNNLGYSYLINNKLNLAIETFQKAIELDGKNNRYRNNLALAYILNDQYDKAYEQFKIIENETKANEKLVSILHKLGKVKVQQYFAKSSNAEPDSSRSETEKPIIVRKKIDYDTPDSSVKTDIADQRLIDRKKEDINFSIDDDKTLLSDEKRTEDGGSLDETNSKKSHAALIESSKIADYESLESIKKPTNQVSQTELNRTIFNKAAAVEDNSAVFEKAQNFELKYSKLSNQTKALPETKNNNRDKSESENLSGSKFYLTSAESVAEAEPEEITFEPVEQAKTYQQNKITPSSHNYYPKELLPKEPTIIGVKNDSDQNDKEHTKKLQNSLNRSDQQILSEKLQSDKADVTSIFAKNKANEDSLIINKKLQSNYGMNLAFKNENLKESQRSDNFILEVEIEVVNGNGENEAAFKFGKYLESKGFKVIKVGNANSFDHSTTKILYCNINIENVHNLLEIIPITPTQKNIIEINNFGNRIKIIIGKDLVEHENLISKAILRKPRT